MNSASEMNAENKQKHPAESRQDSPPAAMGLNKKSAAEMAKANSVLANVGHTNNATTQQPSPSQVSQNAQGVPAHPEQVHATLETREPVEAKQHIAAEPTLTEKPTQETIAPTPESAKKSPVAPRNNQQANAASTKPASNPKMNQQNANQQNSNENNAVQANPNKGPNNNPVRGGQGAAGMNKAKASQGNRKIPRPESWEDDISRNTLDDTPFTSLPSPASRDVADFEAASRLQAMLPLLEANHIGKFIRKDSWPIPTPEDREGYSAGFDENYWLSGLEDYLKIMQVAKNLGVVAKSVLDFGCATGRVVRHFAAQSDTPEVWATDINQRHVRWLYEHMPSNVKPVFNHCIPTLPIPDRSVDIITAFSVFTHIDTFETHWLAELSRIMSDDGMCYLTVHNEDTWKRLEQEKDNEKNRLIQSIVKINPNFKQMLSEPMPDKRIDLSFHAIWPLSRSGVPLQQLLTQRMGKILRHRSNHAMPPRPADRRRAEEEASLKLFRRSNFASKISEQAAVSTTATNPRTEKRWMGKVLIQRFSFS